MSTGLFTAALDIGGTKILLGLIDQQGELVARRRIETQATRGTKDVLARTTATVAKTVSYPMQSSAIHTIAGKQPWAVTIGGRLKHANQDSNRFFPIESGEHGGSSAATATPNRWPYRSPA